MAKNTKDIKVNTDEVSIDIIEMIAEAVASKVIEKTAVDLSAELISDDSDIDRIVEGFEKALQKQHLILNEETYIDDKSEAPAKPCFCGGGPLIFPSGHAPGELSTLHIRCGNCGKEPMFGGYLNANGKHPAHVDFETEEAALDVWNNIMNASLSNG